MMSSIQIAPESEPESRGSEKFDEELTDMATGATNEGYEEDSEEDPDGILTETTGSPTSTLTIEEEQEEALNYVFRETDHNISLYTFEDCFNDSKRVIKAIFSFFLFCILLGCGLVSCGTLLFISGQMNRYVNFKRTGLINETDDDGSKTCSDGPFGDCDQCGVPICIQENDEKCTQKESVRWIWAMFLCQCVPYFVMCLRSLWKISFKKKKTPGGIVLLLVLSIETLSTIGMFLLLYVILPYMDAMRGLFLLSGIGFIPSLLKLFNRPKFSKTREKYYDILLDILAFVGQFLAVFGFSIMHALNTNDQPNRSEWADVCTKTFLSATTDSSMNTVSGPAFIMQDFTSATNITTAEPTLPPLIYNYLQVGELPIGAELWIIPIALILISVGYWENFIDSHSKLCFGSDAINNFRYDISQYRTKIYLVVGLYKISLTLILLVIQHTVNIDGQMDLTMLFSSSNFYENKCHYYEGDVDNPFNDDWLLAAVIQVSVGILCFYISDLTIKGYMQKQSFALPIVLVTPVAFFLLSWACLDCDTYWNFGTYNYWNCYSGKDKIEDIFIGGDNFIWLGIIWFPSFLLLTRYIWYPNVIRLAKLDKIFYYPIPCGATLMQSLSLIRKRNDDEVLTLSDKEKEKRSNGGQRGPVTGIPPNPFTDRYPLEDGMTPNSSTASIEMKNTQNHTMDGSSEVVYKERKIKAKHDKQGRNYEVEDLKVGYVPSLADDNPGEIPFIYMCATMWHENDKEMLQMLKSVFRVNMDQCAKEKAFTLCARKNLYYRFEVHIYFDDAFEMHKEDEKYYKLNSFVKDFVNTINLAASSVMNRPCTVGYPTRYETPYGGRLVWTMPMGENKIVMHLKDKQKIRHKKRWSQIMYMHRILGLGIMDQPVDARYKKAVAQNTYILALDGDIDFKPDAVLILLDMMRRNNEVAAACGRIHPIGSGPMVWYQKFEYSISHWLQKATEHVLGCVLCSPGCFSLFRGTALMDDNVVQTYTTKSTKPLHFVQYDQGEDRWLCTLLLQQGYRVEYSAAADAYTYAPEGFNEFYNQRRRWITSTFANLLDLLRTGRQTAVKNQNISFLYILYQGLLFAASVLGPATIFLLIIGAFGIAFDTNEIVATCLGVVPVVVLMILCFKAKQSTQLFFAALFSVLFAILQMLVIVGMASQMSDQGLCSPTSIFTLFVLGSFLLAAIIHPQEFTNLFHGFLYYLFIPCMYLLLIVYSLCNLHVVTWGTREVKPTVTEKEKEAQQVVKDMKKASPMEKTMAYFNFSKSKSNGVGIDCSPMCIFKCCVNGEEHSIEEKIEIAKTFSEVTKEPESTASPSEEIGQSDVAQGGPSSTTLSLVDINPEIQIESIAEETWIDDSDLFPDGEKKSLERKETIFWEIIITEYLHPLEENKDEKQKLSEGLLDLRNKAVFSFFLIDILLIVLILGMQQIGLKVNWTCGGTTENVALDPIGFLFVFVFGGLLAIQVVGMIIHRMFTFMQIIASTTICSNRKELMPDDNRDSTEDETFTDEQVVALIKQIQRFDLEPDTNLEPDTDAMAEFDEEQGGAVDDIRMVRHDTVNKSSKSMDILTNEDIQRKLTARYVYLSNDVMARRASIAPEEQRRKLSIQGMSLHEFRQKSSLNVGAINAMKKKLSLEDSDVTREEDFIMNAFSNDPVIQKGKAPESYVGFNKNPFRRGSVDSRRPSTFGLTSRRPSLYPPSVNSYHGPQPSHDDNPPRHDLTVISEEDIIEEDIFENGTAHDKDTSL